jgi:hypothetical protein
MREVSPEKTVVLDPLCRPPDYAELSGESDVRGVWMSA